MSFQLPGPQGADGHSACGEFRILSLPAELIFHIASYLPTRSLISLLLTSPAFAHLASLMGTTPIQDFSATGIETLRVYTPLQFFCSRGIESVVRRLLLEGADPNIVHNVYPKCQLSPLTHAIGFHSAGIVSLLLQHGAHLNACRPGGGSYSPLDIAVGQPHQLYTQLLPDHQGYIQRAGQLPQIVQLLLDAGSDITTMHPKRGTPLHIACAARDANPVIVAALIAAGANVHSKFAGYGTLVDRLARGLDGDIQPIHFAASAGNVAIVQMLLDAGADIEAATRNAIRPVDNAVLTMREDVLEMLRAAGADLGTSAPVESLAAGSSKEVRGLLINTAAVLGVADPWVLVRTRVAWSELGQWLVLRGCTANWESMDAWGMKLSPHGRYMRNEFFPFG